MAGDGNRLRRLAAWRVTVTFRPVFVVTFVIVDVLIRVFAPLLEKLITHHQRILEILDVVTGALLFFALFVLAVSAVSPRVRRDHDC